VSWPTGATSSSNTGRCSALARTAPR